MAEYAGLIPRRACPKTQFYGLGPSTRIEIRNGNILKLRVLEKRSGG